MEQENKIAKKTHFNSVGFPITCTFLFKKININKNVYKIDIPSVQR